MSGSVPPPPYDSSQYNAGGFSSGGQYGTASQPPPPPPQYQPPPPQWGYGMDQYGMGVAPVVVQPTSFGTSPVTTFCGSCQANITTSTRPETGTVALLTAALLCFFGCWCCACVPICMDSLKDVRHTCPQCNRIVGIYKARF